MKRLLNALAPLVLAPLVIAGCDDGGADGRGCTTNTDCTGGRVCFSGSCAEPAVGVDGGGGGGGGMNGCPDVDDDGYFDTNCNADPAQGGGDCDDRSAAVYPGALELCTNASDDNCDGVVNENCACVDRDSDGETDAQCGGTDCDDSEAAIRQGAEEICGDSIDNNCNGFVDEGCDASCPDNDGDGFQAARCNGDRATGGDCDDNNGIVNPGAPEQCGNGLDDDCQNGDLACQQACADEDGDGFGLGSGCLGPDCDDTNASINPNASEICGDAINQDCTGGDLACPEECEDADRDGFGVGRGCLGADCDDGNGGINPAAWDLPGDGIDQDCSGADLVLPEDCEDRDRDGYGVGAGCLGADCDDGDPRINAGREEICGNATDDNCDDIDLTCAPVGEGDCVDLDGDGYGEGACLRGGFDCDDMNAAINPGAQDTCNGIDDNCNQLVDECPRDSQICDGVVCVGRAGAPCDRDSDCAGVLGLACDQDAGECRVTGGAICVDGSDCSAGARCVVEDGCAAERRCYEGLAGPCERECDCQAAFTCHDENQRCVECSQANECAPPFTACTTGGYCAQLAQIQTLDDLVGRMIRCWSINAQSGNPAACDVLNVSDTLEALGARVPSIQGPDNDAAIWDYICDEDAAAAAGFTPAQIEVIAEVFGCGFFDILNAWWLIPVQAGSDGELCLYYVPNKAGFGLPDPTRAAVVVERCNLSVIE